MGDGRGLRAGLGLAARFAILGGFGAGLAVAAPAGITGMPPAPLSLAGVLAAGGSLALVAPRGPGQGRAGELAWLASVTLLAAAIGVGVGTARVSSIDAGALRLGAGARVELRGFVIAVPRRADGRVSVRVQTPAGRVMFEAPEPVADLDIGTGVEAVGTIREPTEFEAGYLLRLGIGNVLATREIEVTGERRGGLFGLLDRVRSRAQEALSAGTPAPSSNLLRGFVLGQDDRIDAATVSDFKRSGLAHLLAVSGQNVILLAILATVVLGLVGVPVRPRLITIGVLIGVYVLVTGAGPSIQRAGVMGAAGVAAALAGRPRSRWYALLSAFALTLCLDPRAAADVGWQLSFAAVLGILIFCAPLAGVLAGSGRQPARRAVAEAAAMTISATIATAPLMSFHFGTVSVVSLPANLAAAIAEAPVMWLGMIASAAGQLTWLPVEPITWAGGLVAGYIAAVAHLFAAPPWAQVEVGVGGVVTLAALYALLGAAVALGLRWAGRRRMLSVSLRAAPAQRRAAPSFSAGVAAVLAIAVIAAAGGADGGGGAQRSGLVIDILDVGQGDSILLRPAGGDPILVDAGPPTADVSAALAARGVDRLAALVVTHPDADHSGGAPDLLARVRVARLAFARAPAAVLGAARAAGTSTQRVAAGSVLRDGGLRLRLLWPPPAALRDPGRVTEPNAHSLVALARWHGFRMLLSGDGEAELAPVHPGHVDVLEVAHHGSEDAGLPRLLAEAAPELAVISVGAGNPYGHPSPTTLSELAGAAVPVLRTDTDGELTITVTAHDWSVRGG